MTSAEKQRLYRERRDRDPERRKKYLEYEQHRYKRDKLDGKKKVVPVKDLSASEVEAARQKWREAKKAYKRKVKLKSQEAQISAIDIPRQELLLGNQLSPESNEVDAENPAHMEGLEEKRCEQEKATTSLDISIEKFQPLNELSAEKKQLDTENTGVVERLKRKRRKNFKHRRKRRLEIVLFAGKREPLSQKFKAQALASDIAPEFENKNNKERRAPKEFRNKDIITESTDKDEAMLVVGSTDYMSEGTWQAANTEQQLIPASADKSMKIEGNPSNISVECKLNSRSTHSYLCHIESQPVLPGSAEKHIVGLVRKKHSSRQVGSLTNLQDEGPSNAHHHESAEERDTRSQGSEPATSTRTGIGGNKSREHVPSGGGAANWDKE
ncbi:hypothetical protein PoB_000088700 [Plakobranchus ocellatus]|uniref:Uncharacterized protein n=1 Tax=Plakobranchus ocellatus TaxID=259542 RepID=A0AAV3XW68_9GAST|nr:hypothetical protein PoB_000088700 [Plakobranchus ocellatus]